MPTSPATIKPDIVPANDLSSECRGLRRAHRSAFANVDVTARQQHARRPGHRHGLDLPVRSPINSCWTDWGLGGRAVRAFTLMEMLIVMAVLVIAAAAIMPSIVAAENSRKAKALEASIIRFPLEAKDEAVRSQGPVRIRVESDSLVMERVPLDSSGTQQPESVKTLSLGSNVQVENTQDAGTSTSDASWSWTTYPDGSSDAGGIQFSIDSAEKSLVLPATGPPQWINGPLPDQTQQKWQAGQLATR